MTRREFGRTALGGIVAAALAANIRLEAAPDSKDVYTIWAIEHNGDIIAMKANIRTMTYFVSRTHRGKETLLSLAS